MEFQQRFVDRAKLLAPQIAVIDGAQNPVLLDVGPLQLGGDLVVARIVIESLLETNESAYPASVYHRDPFARTLEIESLTAGSGTPVLLLHGLAANKLSFLPTLVGLAEARLALAMSAGGSASWLLASQLLRLAAMSAAVIGAIRAVRGPRWETGRWRAGAVAGARTSPTPGAPCPLRTPADVPTNRYLGYADDYFG